MKFTINSGCLYDALSSLSRSVLANPTPQILCGIKIVAHSEGLTLIVSNHNFFLKKEIVNCDGNLNIIEKGTFVGPAKYLAELIKKLPGEITVGTGKNNKLFLQADEIRIQLNGFNVDEYPSLPKVNSDETAQLPANHLLEMVKQTAFAASVNDSRQVLTGILITFLNNKIRCAATNSHRLSISELDFDTAIAGSYIVPLNTIREFIRLFNDSSTIAIHVSDHYFVFESQDLSLYSRLIEGNYPDLSSIIPSESKTSMILSTRKVLNAIDRASLFTRDSSRNNVKLNVTQEGRLRVASYSSDLGETEETIPIRELQGDPEILISLNNSFLIDALKSIPDEEIVMSFSGSMRPVVIKPNSDKQHLQLISPVRG
ncbi:DNA polymerase III subunit beta [Bacillus sp. ISL-35]|uniref:DNA polymerase III subunit beta n=1 Tax=Bacillus sp. ISL-35 TaxID=2819122 RepID=UPI001BE685C1|nr:DNA polymerase III subunit beta [Bacillus sp. ISL-35]MBT2681074.1 DNA polymerase III subunit beta [Bacillus sp. ISL-35]MBT2705394.1 DNA polymerase III subunit beta [Chryseobacterium sp. ISL-80]